jgi:hypothetical protein
MSKQKRKISIEIEGIEYELGPDIDLDAEEVRLSDGTRLTEERAARWGIEVASRPPGGRPSLGEPGHVSPRISFRVSERTRERAEHRARAEGKTISEFAREVLERYLND